MRRRPLDPIRERLRQGDKGGGLRRDRRTAGVQERPRRGLAGHVGYISPDRVLGVGHPLADDASEAFQSWRTSWTTTHCMAGGGQRWGRCPKCEAESDGLCNNCPTCGEKMGE